MAKNHTYGTNNIDGKESLSHMPLLTSALFFLIHSFPFQITLFKKTRRRSKKRKEQCTLWALRKHKLDSVYVCVGVTVKEGNCYLKNKT